MKTCIHCQKTKPIIEFNKSKKAKDGLQSWCKQCKREYIRVKEKSNQLCKCGCGEYTYIAPRTRKENGWIKGQPLQYLKGHYKEGNKVEMQPRPKSQKNGLKQCTVCIETKTIDNYNKDNNNPDGLSYYCRDCQRKRWKQMKHRYANRKIPTDRQRVKKFKRRAVESNAEGFCDIEAIQQRVEYFGSKCWMCGGTYEEVDHVIPLNKGGTNWASNLRPICKSCNSAKSDRWLGVEKQWLLVKRYAKNYSN